MKKINWKEGASSALCYLATAWLMVLSIALFLESYNAYSKVGKTQLLSDIVSDGSCFIGDTGWGLSEANAIDAKEMLLESNEEDFSDISVPSSGSSASGEEYFDIYTSDERGVRTLSAEYLDHGDDNKNTVSVTSKLDGETLTTNQALVAERNAKTRISYSGGLKIVREAWHYSYEYNPATQTPYVWGGGHGSNDLGCLSSGADCSGFVSAIFRKCGYESIVGNRCTWDLEYCGKEVGSDLEKARPGDIILYWWSGTEDAGSDHVGIYAGKHNGVHYQIEAKGGRANSIFNPGSGADKGVHLTPVSSGRASRIKIMRIVNSEGKGEEVPEVTIGNLTRNQTIIYHSLKEAGFTANAIRGIMGNWVWEGNCSPIVREDHGNPDDSHNTNYAERIRNKTLSKEEFVFQKRFNGRPEGYGIAQWTTTSKNDPYGDRKAKLWDYAQSLGSDVTSLEVQVGFAIKEMREHFNLTPLTMNGMSYQEACTAFFDNFEAGGGVHDVDGTLNNRIACAGSLDIPYANNLGYNTNLHWTNTYTPPKDVKISASASVHPSTDEETEDEKDFEGLLPMDVELDIDSLGI